MQETMDRLKGKIAVVTGGANGIGAAISEMFAEEGASVVVVDLERETAEALVKTIEGNGGIAKPCQCDVSKQEEAVEAIRLATEWNGRIDILCNNAAYMGPFHAVLESTALEWDRCIQVALLGTHYFCARSTAVHDSAEERFHHQHCFHPSHGGLHDFGLIYGHQSRSAGLYIERCLRLWSA